MSIMPEGGWGELNPPDKTDSPQRAPSASDLKASYSASSSYLRCKICDSGTLISKKVFRLSGPAVAIGYILLIPSVLGIISCATMLIAINAGVVTRDSSRPSQSAFESNFRQSCAQSARQRIQEQGYNVSHQLIEQYCECALTQFKVTGSATLAGQACNERLADGTLDKPAQDVDALYSGNTVQDDRETKGLYLLRGISSAFVIAWGVAFFVSGLLGWLLVMTKRVLQCNLCGAVVNAS
ncbi:MAG: hypothetical protein WBP85_00625 [Terracidiphilus sp.]